MPSFITSDGVRIRYERRGDGAPIFVCQGGPNNNCDTLIRDLAPLTATYTMIFHDYRGSGMSATAPVESYRFDRLADDLDELREHLGYEAVSVLAHSMGGLVALEFALRHPDHCERLALVGTTPCGAARPMATPAIRALSIRGVSRPQRAGIWFLCAWSWRGSSSNGPRRRDAVMVAGGDLLVSGVVHAQRTVLDDVGHEVFIEAPTEAFDALRAFLNG